MKKVVITLSIIFASLAAFSQTAQTLSDSLIIQQLQQNIRQLRIDLTKQKADFSKRLSITNDSLALLHSEIAAEKKNTVVVADKLGLQIVDAKTDATQQIQNVRDKVNTNTLYWVIAVLTIALLSIALFIWLFKRQKMSSADIVAQLEKTKSSVEEQLVKEFSKQAEVMETLVKVLRATTLQTNASAEPDHSLALKLADEITLMERNLSLMDTGTKGLRQLNRSIGKLKDNLAANGYEIPELLGKSYNEGLKAIITNTIQDKNLEKGVELITKIIKPQVNFNDKMIQAAQIEVSVR
jgi:uncharacterized membrane-anchored protein YhcB (DUF1043 family)